MSNISEIESLNLFANLSSPNIFTSHSYSFTRTHHAVMLNEGNVDKYMIMMFVRSPKMHLEETKTKIVPVSMNESHSFSKLRKLKILGTCSNGDISE